MKRFEAEWLSYKMHIPSDAPEIQFHETRRAFYAGALALFSQVTDMFDPKSPEPTSKDLASMQDLYKELMDFVELVKAGSA